jgi:PTH1 family peptidyl-tRNA hydrolase
LQLKKSNESLFTNAIVGLGNPGKRYEKTRHNIGFMILDELNDRYNGNFKKENNNYLLTKIFIQSIPSFLVKPITFMNNSGLALRQFIHYYKINNFSNLLIVLDDINLPFGTIRLRDRGSSGGQKGLQSIIGALNTEDIPRLRIGVGNPFENTIDYVLSSFTRNERKILPEIINFAADAVEMFILNGIASAMNNFNRNILDL